MSTPRTASYRRIALLSVVFLSLVSGLSAHVVRGTHATAFVSSPTGTEDAPIKVKWVSTQIPPTTVDSGLRVMCFYTANTTEPRVDDPEWPRITSVGFELPDVRSGFALLEPPDGWTLVEGTEAEIPGRGTVRLDVALVANVNPTGYARRGPNELIGIPPGQQEGRRNGTRFCISGPFPDTLPNPAAPQTPLPATVERLLNGVVIGFHHVQRHGPRTDIGLWDNPMRTVPLYPE